jgi:hypothetical protein
MEFLEPLSDFFSAIENDPRISITHIGIYAALLQYWKEHDFQIPVQVFSYEIMCIAKISASTTFHKVIRELNEYGYIRYEPSFKRNKGSKIYVLSKKSNSYCAFENK